MTVRRTTPAKRRGLAVFGYLGIGLLLLVAVVVASFAVLRQLGGAAPIPGQQRCVATANQSSVSIDLEQAHYASIIVGVSIKRGLPARAASIAIATAYQESGIRNLDHGDRDSVGLFQQRPSQGWGTVDQIMDPYYATGVFYDGLVKIPSWKTANINDVAQQVQRSGYPEGYRQHEPNARILASALTGHSTAGFTCLERKETAGNPRGLRKFLSSTLGAEQTHIQGKSLTVTTSTTTMAWTIAHHAIANSGRYGVSHVSVAGQSWQQGGSTLPRWQQAPSIKDKTVVITVR